MRAEPKVIQVLCCLAEHAPKVVSKEQLLHTVWAGTFVTDDVLTHAIAELRKAFQDDARCPQVIQTIAKGGYRLIAPVQWETHYTGEPTSDLRAYLECLKRATDSSRSSAAVEAALAARPKWLVPAGVVLAVAVVAALWVLVARRPVPPAAPRLSFTQLTDQPGQELWPSLSPDGKSLAYAAETAPGNSDIFVQRVGGRNPLNLTKDSPVADTTPAFSPDGEQIAFRSSREGGGIFIMGATGESVRRLTDFGYNPSWSPDGKEIVCSTEAFVRPNDRSDNQGQLWRVNTATGEKRQITTSGDAVQPAWSPHGYRIAYWANIGGQRDIWTIPAEGGRPVAVTNDPHMDWSPVWSPDANYLYFASDHSGSMNLWRVAIEEKSGKVLAEPEPLTTPADYSGYLSIARDGRKLAYVNLAESQNIHRVGFDAASGKTVSPLAPVTPGSRVELRPDVSPDGEWLASSTLGKQEDIFVIRRDGSGLRQLTNDKDKDRYPRWSPDGKRIAFYSNRSGRYEIWTINPDGSGLQQLTETTGMDLIFPVWSPDGTRLACSDLDRGTYLIEAGRTKQAPQPLPKWEGGVFVAWSWSPDGKTLAGFLNSPPGGIVLYAPQSRQYRKLTDSGNGPFWLKDGRRLLFSHRGRINIADANSGKVQEVLSLPQRYLGGPSLSPDNRTLYFIARSSEADVWLATLDTEPRQ